jgi:glucosamine--fructose-6-phosphate aminotransferase (isomerizing)
MRQSIPPELCKKVARVFVTGCGDSHHAALNSELAFEQLAGLPCEPQAAMQFSRFGAGFMPDTGHNTNLLIGVSVSGQVSRTVEAVELGRKGGAATLALTGNKDAPLAGAAELLLETAVPPQADQLSSLIVPGTRSYYASQLALYLLAIHLGQERGHLAKSNANQLRRELAEIADYMEETIAVSDALALKAAEAWLDAESFVFCGSGPNYGAALFSAAKLLEASGDTAVAQDMEEWAHLQYFARQVATPTFLISSGPRDADRTLEIAEAARAIGRRLALIAPDSSPLAHAVGDDFVFPLFDTIRDTFSPLLTPLPAILFAAYRAQLLGEPYFRDFGGGRSSEGGGGISRIRNSHKITDIIH